MSCRGGVHEFQQRLRAEVEAVRDAGRIRAGSSTFVTASTWACYRNPKLFKNPLAFDPTDFRRNVAQKSLGMPNFHSERASGPGWATILR